MLFGSLDPCNISKTGDAWFCWLKHAKMQRLCTPFFLLSHIIHINIIPLGGGELTCIWVVETCHAEDLPHPPPFFHPKFAIFLLLHDQNLFALWQILAIFFCFLFFNPEFFMFWFLKMPYFYILSLKAVNISGFAF